MKRNSSGFRHLMIAIQLFYSAVVASATAQAQEPRPSQSDLAWVTAEVPAPRVSFRTFDSAAAKTKVSYHIYTPAAYDQDAQKRFPVVYWLHGSGGGLPGIPRVAALFDAAIEAGKTPPCLVVFVNGLVEGMYVDWKDGSAPLETIIIKELIPHIDATYRTIASRDGRLLDGYSMGGYGSARLGFKYTELFSALSIMGGGPLQAELIQAPRAGRLRAAELLQKVYGGDQEYFRSVSPRRLAKENAEAITKGSLIRMVCGDQDETFSNNRAFHEHLEKLAIPHTWTVLEGIDHNPMRTLEALGDSNWQFYRQAFGQAKKTPSPPRKSEVEIRFKIKQQDRRAVIVNAPTDGTKRPVVIALHGGQGSAEIMRANSGFDPVAKAKGFMVVYGEGTDFGGKRHAWNTGFLLRRQVRDADDIAYLDTLIDKLIQEHDADATRIYLTGGSNGGMMTFVYALARPERLAAVAPVVASMFTFDKKPAVPLPILIINGAKDEEVPLEGGMSRNPLVSRAQEAPFKPLKDVVQFWVEVNRSQKTGQVENTGTVTTTTYVRTSDGAATEFVVDSAGAHGWPGSRARRQDSIPISSFSGAERVWQFFQDKQRKAP
ncbi:MAG: alpha/beta hydrolase-fold protein [Planctomycetota bacterium]